MQRPLRISLAIEERPDANNRIIYVARVPDEYRQEIVDAWHKSNGKNPAIRVTTVSPSIISAKIDLNGIVVLRTDEPAKQQTFDPVSFRSITRMVVCELELR